MQVLKYLNNNMKEWGHFDDMVTSDSELLQPAQAAQHEILQLVGIGEGWQNAEDVCSKFGELKNMLLDAALGAILGQDELSSMVHRRELECLKFDFLY